jgi:hypothetical protein
MVKGAERRVVVVKDVESEYFETAIFVIKSGAKQPKNDRTLSEEACVIIRKLFGLKPPITTISNRVFPSIVKLTAAAAIGAALMGVISRL